MRLGLICCFAVASFAQKRTVTDAEVQRVHRSALLIDTHNDFPTELGGKDRPAGSAIEVVKSPANHTDLTRLRVGGVGAVFFADYVAARYGLGEAAYKRANEVPTTCRITWKRLEFASLSGALRIVLE